MRVLGMLLKVTVGLAIAIPVGILVFALTLGAIGTLLAFAFLALRLACIGLVGYGVYRLARLVFAPKPKVKAPEVRDLPRADPYYEAAMRELDAEFRGSARSH